MIALDVCDLRAGYRGADVLEGVSLRLEAAECIAVLGANGAGKTTLLRSLSGLIPMRGGSVEVFGKRPSRNDPASIARLGIAHAPEGRGTIPTLTVEENLRVGALTLRKREAVEETLAECFDLFPILRTYRHKSATNLSGGEQQMLALGRALMSRPRIVLLDEPSFGLAPRILHTVYEAIGRMIRELGVAVLLVEQTVDLALSLSSRAYVLRNGRVAAEGTPETIRKSAALREAYVGSGNGD